MVGAALVNADLNGGDLSDASLIDALLIEADLRVADLSGADLEGADLRLADLLRADLSGASLIGALLIDARLKATYDELTIFPSGLDIYSGDWGLPDDAAPWNLGMIPAPEPTSCLILAVGALALAGAGRR